MRIVVTSETDTYYLEVSEDLELENFKVLCEAESGIPSSDAVVAFNGRRLADEKKSLKDYGIKDGDLIMVMSGVSILQRAAERMHQINRNPAPLDMSQFDFASIQVPRSALGQSRGQNLAPSAVPSDPVVGSSRGSSDAIAQGQDHSKLDRGNGGGRPVDLDDLGLGENAGSQDDPAVIRDMLLANPEQLALLKHNNPKLADALTSGDLDRFATVLKEQQEARKDRERQRIRLISSDPFDMEAQKLIAEEIQRENINANMEAAMEFNPESFGTVHMLYINCLVNGYPVKAFIDSGAQTTIMSQCCAERCNIMRLVDTRWAGIAKGVGVQRIIGRVHMGQIEIGGAFLASSFSILEEQPVDMLLGLDMLRRHQMCIDLKANELVIGTTSSRTPFLGEGELPDCARLTTAQGDDDIRPQRQTEDHALNRALAESAAEHTSQQQLKASSPERSSFVPASETTSRSTTNIPSSAPAPSNVEQSHPSFPESDIIELMQIGFSREDVVQELRRQGGNKTQTIAALFAKSFKMDQ